MASSTANDIMERALVKARVFHPADAIPAAILSQVFLELNDMLERWALERLMVVAEVLESFPLVAGQASYTYGSGGDFNSVRPDYILGDAFIRSGTTDFPLDPRPLSIYRQRSEKATQARPQIFAVNPAFPLTTVYFWPTPNAADSVYLRVRKQLTSFSDKTTSVDLPKGFRGGIVANLAVEISPNFGKKVSKELAYQAALFVKAIKNANQVSNRPMRSDLGSMTGNVRSPRFSSGPFI